MSSYAERLGSFNNAVSATNQHIDTLKSALQNPELRDNPAKLGTELAGSVLGTTGGLIGVRNRLVDHITQRNFARAFYNKLGSTVSSQGNTARGIGDSLLSGLGSIKDQTRNMGSSIGDIVNQNLANVKDVGQSLASQVADTGKIATNSIQNIRSGATNAPQSVGQSDLDAVDNGINTRIQNFPSTGNATTEANNISNSINSKISSSLDATERQGLNNSVSGQFSQRVNQVNAFDDSNPLKQTGLQKLLQAKNNMANDAIARKNVGLPPADSYDSNGGAVSQGTQGGSSNTGQSGQSNTQTSDANGSASVGDNATQSVAADTGGTSDTALPHNGSASIGQASDLNPIQTTGEDVTTAIQDTQNAGQNIIDRANNLKLMLGQVPNQSSQGTVQGLTTALTSESVSGKANIVSQAQGADAIQHATAQASGSQVQPDASAQSAGASADAQQGANEANKAMNMAGTDASSLIKSATTGAQSADDIGTGLTTALGVEGTLDELAPATGPLAPILEAGSLLATLGTSIASLFEKPKQSTPQAPPPQSLSVGANLKSDASGSVGAF